MLIAFFILFLVGMDGQVAVLTADQAFLLCVKAVANCSTYGGRWVADCDLVAIIRHEYSFWNPEFDNVLTYTKLNKAIKKDAVLELKISGGGGANDSGLFRRQYKPKELTYTSVDVTDGGYEVKNDSRKNARTAAWYFFGTARRIKEKNDTGRVWYEANGGLSSGDIVKNERRKMNVSTDERIRIAAALGVDLTAGTKQAADGLEDDVNSSDDMDVEEAVEEGGDGEAESFHQQELPPPPQRVPTSPSQSNKRKRTAGQERRREKEFEGVDPSSTPWWQSEVPRVIFGAREDEAVQECITRRIRFLDSVVGDFNDGHRKILDDGDAHDRCTMLDREHIYKQAISVRTALVLARKAMPKDTWEMVCRDAAEMLKEFHNITVGSNSIQQYNIMMRQRDRLPHPRGIYNGDKKDKPPIFQDYPDCWRAFIKYASLNLEELSVVFMRSFVVDVVKKGINEGREIDFSKKGNLSEKSNADSALDNEEIKLRYGIKTWSDETVRRWMKVAGFSYCEHKKHYYVDNHEHPNIVKYRKEFTERYLKREKYMYRWVHVTVEVAEQLEKDGHVPKDTGYRHWIDTVGQPGTVPGVQVYNLSEADKDDRRYQQMVEYHLDESEELKKHIPGGEGATTHLPGRSTSIDSDFEIR